MPLKAITLVEGKETAAPDLHAHAGAVLEGTVVDAETDTPLPDVGRHGYTAVIRSAMIPTPSFVYADKSGHFLLRTSRHR